MSAVAWEHRPGEQGNFTVDEYTECNEALKKNPRVIAALERHGIHDMDRVLVDTWAYGGLLVPDKHRGRRVGWTDVWLYNEEGSNPYANPITGLHLIVDVNTLELLEIQDTGQERPRTMGEYIPRLVPGQRLRDDIKPLEIVQPHGVSFTLDGNHLTWQRWLMRIGFNPREGMVIQRSPTGTASAYGPWPSGSRSPRWSSPTATQPTTTGPGRRSISASGAWAS